MNQLSLTIVLILGALTAFAPMSIDMYLPAFPALASSLGTSPGMVAYTLSAFFIGLSLGQMVYGPLADRFGRKPPLVVGVVLYILASLGCMAAPNIEALIAMRFLQAFGGCAGPVISRAMVRDQFDAQGAARLFSLLMLVMGLAPILAPLLGGQVLGWAGWRGIFAALALFGGACLVATLAALPETLAKDARAALGFGEVLKIYGGLLRHPRFMGNALAGACVQAGMFAYIAGSPFVFITLYQVPPDRYGWLFGLNAAGLIAASQVNGKLLQRCAASRLLGWAIGFALLMALWVAVGATTGWGGLLGLLVPLFGFLASLGFIGPNATASALGSQRTHHGQASALLGTLQFGAATVSGALIGLLQDGTARPMGWVIAGCAAISGGVFALWAREARPAQAAALFEAS